MRNWFFTDYSVPSQKNGVISVRRRFGEWWVAVGDCGQTSQYTHVMWKKAFKHLRMQNNLPLKGARVLMLGLGGGGQIKTIYKNIPHAILTVVEYDPAMIKIATELRLYAPYPLPTIIEGDAAEVAPKLGAVYDLIIVDLFSGPEPSPLATDTTFVQTLNSSLSPQGYLLANMYKRPEYLDSLSNYLKPIDRWQFIDNSLGLFSRI